MKNYKIKVTSRDYGELTDWYIHENLPAVEAANPMQYSFGGCVAGAYFVFATSWTRDDARDYAPVYRQESPLAGPFDCEESAKAWVENNLNADEWTEDICIL